MHVMEKIVGEFNYPWTNNLRITNSMNNVEFYRIRANSHGSENLLNLSRFFFFVYRNEKEIFIRREIILNTERMNNVKINYILNILKSSCSPTL